MQLGKVIKSVVFLFSELQKYRQYTYAEIKLRDLIKHIFLDWKIYFFENLSKQTRKQCFNKRHINDTPSSRKTHTPSPSITKRFWKNRTPLCSKALWTTYWWRDLCAISGTTWRLYIEAVILSSSFSWWTVGSFDLQQVHDRVVALWKLCFIHKTLTYNLSIIVPGWSHPWNLLKGKKILKTSTS